MHGHRHDDDVGVTDDVLGCGRVSAGGEHLNDQFDAVRSTRARYATSYPAATAARRWQCPSFRRRQCPRGLLAASCRDTVRSTGCSNRSHGGGGQLDRWICEELSHPWNHLATVELDGRHLLFWGTRPVA